LSFLISFFSIFIKTKAQYRETGIQFRNCFLSHAINIFFLSLLKQKAFYCGAVFQYSNVAIKYLAM